MTPVNDNERHILFQSTAFEVVRINWKKSSHSRTEANSFHDHGWSQCAVLVQKGQFKNFLRLGTKIEEQDVTVGALIETPTGALHDLQCLSETGETLHVYTPRLKDFAPLQFRAEAQNDLHSRLKLKDSSPWSEVSELLNEVQHQAVSTHSPYFMNQLFSGVNPQVLAAEKIIAETKTTLATHEASSVFSFIENHVVESLGQQIGWPASQREGVGVPGGSAANFMAVHCARHRLDQNIKQTGHEGKRLCVFVSSEAHYSLKKACAVLGLGTNNLILVAVDPQGRMLAEDLKKQISKVQKEGGIPLMVCATAGTTVQGAFDPIDELSSLCEKEKVWLHVDAAWGSPALFSKRLRPLVRGVEKADSVTFDAHKLFGAGLPCSFFLTRHTGLLQAANDVTGADYLFHQDAASEAMTRDLGKLSWQCGRRADSLSFWALWKSLGTEGLGQMTDQLLSLRDEFVGWVKDQPRLQLLQDPSFLNVCIRVIPPEGKEALAAEWSRHVRETLILENKAMINFSSNPQGTFLRLILAHPGLEMKHLVEMMRAALDVG